MLVVRLELLGLHTPVTSCNVPLSYRFIAVFPLVVLFLPAYWSL